MPVTLRLVVAILSLLLIGPASFAGPATEFTYQGRLDMGGQPYTGTADFEFEMYQNLVGGFSVWGGINARSAVAVTGGLFTVTLDFGFHDYANRPHLQVRVRAPAGAGAFTTLSPRQRITPAPMAMSLFGGQITSGTTLVGVFASANASVGVATNVVQTFTMPEQADIARIQVDVIRSGTGDVTIPLTLKQGTTVLATSTALVPVGQSRAYWSFPPGITLSNGLTYSFEFPTTALLDARLSTTNPYPGGACNVGGGTADLIMEIISHDDPTMTLSVPLRLFDNLPRTGASLLSVYGNSSDYIAMTLTNSATGGGQWNAEVNGGSAASGGDKIVLSEGTFRTPRVTVLEGGRVGIGTTAPAQLLHVAGNAQFDGAISTNATTRSKAISCAAMRVASGSATVSNFEVQPSATGQAVTLLAPLELPVGATITRITAYGVDNTSVATEYFTVSLIRTFISSGTGSSIASASSIGLPSSGLIQSVSVSPAETVTATKSFMIQATLTAISGSLTSLRLSSVVVEYTVTSPMP